MNLEANGNDFSLDDLSLQQQSTGACTLHDAITAANSKTATNGCTAGTGNDTINFSVTGTVLLAGTLPQVTAGQLTINGPASPGITIDGGGKVQVMQIAPGATLRFNHLTVANGSSSVNDGGGIENSGTLLVNNGTFFGNSAGGYGGGIVNAGTLLVNNGTFFGNSAGGYGGGIVNAGTLTVTRSTFSNNHASSGGAIGNNADGILSVTNSTFSGNTAISSLGGDFGFGGAIYNAATSTITDSTFSDNVSSTFGGGGGIFGGAGGTFLTSTIVARSGSGGNCGGTITDAGYNISDDASCGFSASGSVNNTDPMLNPAGLRNNGGPTQTISLLSGSPAIDAIPLADCIDQALPPNAVITDQRGFPRPDSEENACDTGAFEVQDAPFTPFARFGGQMRIDPDAGTFFQGGGFVLKSGSTIDPTTQPVSFSVGSYAVRIPAGSFVKDSVGYVYQNTVDGITLYIHIRFTSTPGTYQLNTQRHGGTLAISTSPVPVTLAIGPNFGPTSMYASFY